MASKKKTKTVVEADKSYVLLYDTFGGGLSTFSFGLDVIRGGEELEDYILAAARELIDYEESEESIHSDVLPGRLRHGELEISPALLLRFEHHATL